MTKEEAIKILQNPPRVYDEKMFEALDVAIEALSAEQTDLISKEYKTSIDYTHHDSLTTDFISRSDTIEAVHKYFVDAFNNEPHEIDDDGDDVFTDMKSVNALLHHNKHLSKALKALPSADRPSGEWVLEDEYGDLWVCDQCGFAGEYKSNYCPNCGADMRGERNE